MRHHLFDPSKVGNQFTTAILVKQWTFDQPRMLRHYAKPLEKRGIPLDQQVALTLAYDDAKKVSAARVKEYSAKLLGVLTKMNVTHVYCTDGTYFKYLTGMKKAEAYLGYALPCAVPGYEDITVVYGINYQVLVYAPDKETLMNQGLEALGDHYNGCYVPPGTSIINSESYPDDLVSIRKALGALHLYDTLAVDIEGFSLKLGQTGIGTIGFAWTKHDFISFKVDLHDLLVAEAPGAVYSENRPNEERRQLLRDFFRAYKGRMRFHSATFDVKHLIFHLFMKDALDYPGTLAGLDIFSKIDCTKVLSYLATNSCSGNLLGLKAQSQEFTGNYAVDDIQDITKIPVPKLLRYNGVDCMATNYVYDKHMPTVIADEQLDLYNGLMLDSIRLILNTELVGMPMCPKKVVETKVKLEKLQKEYLEVIQDHPMTVMLTAILQNEAMVKTNAKLKTKQHPLEKFKDVQFNPGSPLQLQTLLYELMKLPIIARTPTKAPATGGKVIKQLLDHENAKPYLDLLQALIDYSAVTKIIQAFIPAFENGMLKADGMRYLHGVFNLGGTVSGRLSSSDPNMQNLPAGSTYGKLIKEMFMGGKGWLFAGADFSSLEDYISALTTKDPMKLKVYIDGFDGHCLRAYAYFGAEMPDIEVAPAEAPCYKANVGNQVIYFHADEDVEYLGVAMKGKELYAKLSGG